MILSFLFLLISSIQQHGSEAESSLSNKFQHTSMKDQNGVQNSQHEKVITVTGDGVVHSPEFPHTYPRNKVLVWRLVAADENMQIQLTFDERFGLEDPEDGICKYDFVEIEEPSEGNILGRWCGSQSAPGKQVSKGNQIRIRFKSDEYFPSEPGFCIRYSLLPRDPTTCNITKKDGMKCVLLLCHTESILPFSFHLLVLFQEWNLSMWRPIKHSTKSLPVPESPAVLPPSLQTMDMLIEAVSGLSTVEEVMKYLDPERWQLDLDDLYKPTWHILGKSFIHPRKSRVVDLNLLREEVRLYSCTPRNFSVSLREELKRTDTIFWPNCLLVKRCGGNCACCAQNCFECQCVPTKVIKKYHEVLQLRHRSGGRGWQKSMTDVLLEHHEECDCMCKSDSDG
nr:PREDICTED: platelet-derived growth factor C isoform X1 [Lepisosteus oculatus]